MRAGENRSDIEVELESEEPMEMGSDTSSSKNEGSRSVIATSVERHEPMVVSTSGGREAERCSNVPAPRKHVVSSDTIGEREVKRTRSPRPSEASPALSPPAPGTAGQDRRSRSRLTPPHHRGWRQHVTHNGGTPRQLLRSVRLEPAVAATRGPIGSRPGRLPPS